MEDRDKADLELAKLVSMACIERAIADTDEPTQEDRDLAMADPTDTIQNIVINTILTSEGYSLERITMGLDPMPEQVVIKSPLTGSLVFRFVQLYVNELTVDQITETLASLVMVRLVNEGRVVIPKNITDYIQSKNQ